MQNAIFLLILKHARGTVAKRINHFIVLGLLYLLARYPAVNNVLASMNLAPETAAVGLWAALLEFLHYLRDKNPILASYIDPIVEGEQEAGAPQIPVAKAEPADPQ